MIDDDPAATGSFSRRSCQGSIFHGYEKSHRALVIDPAMVWIGVVGHCGGRSGLMP